MVRRVAVVCFAMPFAFGLMGVLLLFEAIHSPSGLWRKYKNDKIQGRWRRLKIGLRMAGAAVAILMALPFAVLFSVFMALRSPSEFARDQKQMRERSREWARLRAQRRVLKWEEAKARVSSGNGTFVAVASGSDIDQLWWIHEKRESIDPEGRMPSLADEGNKPFLRGDRRRFEAAALRASWVDSLRTPDLELLDTVSALPNFEVRWPEFESIALRGSPLSEPSGGPAADVIRAKRDRLLDQKDSLIAQLEYTEASVIDPQLQSVERKLFELDHDEEPLEGRERDTNA